VAARTRGAASRARAAGSSLQWRSDRRRRGRGSLGRRARCLGPFLALGIGVFLVRHAWLGSLSAVVRVLVGWLPGEVRCGEEILRRGEGKRKMEGDYGNRRSNYSRLRVGSLCALLWLRLGGRPRGKSWSFFVLVLAGSRWGYLVSQSFYCGSLSCLFLIGFAPFLSLFELWKKSCP
jgi:hypothetical protein